MRCEQGRKRRKEGERFEEEGQKELGRLGPVPLAHTLPTKSVMVWYSMVWYGKKVRYVMKVKGRSKVGKVACTYQF